MQNHALSRLGRITGRHVPTLDLEENLRKRWLSLDLPAQVLKVRRRALSLAIGAGPRRGDDARDGARQAGHGDGRRTDGDREDGEGRDDVRKGRGGGDNSDRGHGDSQRQGDDAGREAGSLGRGEGRSRYGERIAADTNSASIVVPLTQSVNAPATDLTAPADLSSLTVSAVATSLASSFFSAATASQSEKSG